MKFLAAALLLVCLSSGHAQQLKSDQRHPCNVKSRMVEDAQYYDRYWRCEDGEPILYDCPNGLVYAGRNRGVAENCDYPWRVRALESGEKQLANGPISTNNCDWLYGIFGHETSCSKYYTCWNGTATEGRCSTGLLFNEDTHSCDWASNVKGCQKHPLCKENSDGAVPLGNSCERYWQCQGGYPRLQRCPAQTVFHTGAVMKCLARDSEECKIPTTTTPLPELEDEEGRRGGRPGQNFISSGGSRSRRPPTQQQFISQQPARQQFTPQQPARQQFTPQQPARQQFSPQQQPSRQQFTPQQQPARQQFTPEQPSRQQIRPQQPSRQEQSSPLRGSQQQSPIQGPLPRQPPIPAGARPAFPSGAIPLNNGQPVITRRN